jgi:hypothetical protein
VEQSNGFSTGEMVEAVTKRTGESRALVQKRVTVTLSAFCTQMELTKEGQRGSYVYRASKLLNAPKAPLPSGVAKNYAAFRAQIKTPATAETES